MPISDQQAANVFASLIELEPEVLPDPPHPVPLVDPDAWEFRRDDSPASSADLFYEG